MVPAGIKKKIHLNVHRASGHTDTTVLLLPEVQTEDGKAEIVTEFVTQSQTCLF
jgi:hypothetical protein